MAMATGGGDVVSVSPRAEQPPAKKRRTAAAGQRHQPQAATPSLPLDIIVEIAARSDAATLVRCAATCREARRRIADDPTLLGRLRPRDTGRFLLPLLRGHLAGVDTYNDYGDKKTIVELVDPTASEDAAAHLDLVDDDDGETFRDDIVPLDSRGGLVLVRATATATGAHPWPSQLIVCNPATGCHLALPPAPEFPLDHPVRNTDVQYVLLVGDGDGNGEGGAAAAAAAVSRPFQVLKVELVLSKRRPCERRLLVHAFSSEHGGAWSPLTEIPTPNLQGSGGLHPRPVVAGDAVHWLCLTDSKSYVLTLHVSAARVTETALPASFPRDGKKKKKYDEIHHYLLATASAGGDPIVLVADADKISAWEQSKSKSKHSKAWKTRPQVIIETQGIEMVENHAPDLVCFAERSGVVLLGIYGCRLLWLDLHSKKIVQFAASSDRLVLNAQVYCPYEVDPSSWVPTFSRAAVPSNSFPVTGVQ